MNERSSDINPPESVVAIVDCGFATWADNGVDDALRARFDEDRMPVIGLRHVRVWGLQVDDERELPGLERTQIPDEEIWEIKIAAKDGSKYEIDSRKLKPAR